MAGPSDIAAILSQGGRIEKISQSSFVQPDIARQVLTEEEAKERLRKSREVNESHKGREIAAKDRDRRNARDEQKRQTGEKKDDALEEPTGENVKKHLIDVVV
jgi:hypothetical protein